MPRLSREVWPREGLHVLAEQKVNAMTFDSLTRMMQVMKGSFFCHHSCDFAAYKTAFLAYFEDASTHDAVGMLEQVSPPTQKVRRLSAIAAFAHSNPDRAIRNLAAQDQEAWITQTRTDEQRIAYVQSLCSAQQRIAYVQRLCTAWGIERPQTHCVSQFTYVILVGSQQ